MPEKGGIPWNKGLNKNSSSIVHEMSKKLKGRKVWNQGRAWTEREREQIRRTLKKKHASGKLVIWNKGLTKETSIFVKKMSNTKIRKFANGELKISKKQRKDISNTLKKKYQSGQLEVKFIDGVTVKKYKKILGHRVRSRWEGEFCLLLTKLGISYRYEPKRFILKDNKNVITYRPDIYLYTQKIWVEIKGDRRGYKEDSYYKYRLFGKNFPEKTIIIIPNKRYYFIMHNKFTKRTLLRLLRSYIEN